MKIPSNLFSEISEKIEKSACRRIKDTETGQSEILKMIENLSSKIDSLSNGTHVVVNAEMDEIDLVNRELTTRLSEMYELPRHESQHMVTGVPAPQEILRDHQACHHPYQKYPDDTVNKLMESLKNVTQQNRRLPRLQRQCEFLMDAMTNLNTFKSVHQKPKSVHKHLGRTTDTLLSLPSQSKSVTLV